MPFAFSMKHYQIFGDATSEMKDQELASPESWDALRKNHPFFSISPDRNEWLVASEVMVKKDGQDDQLKQRAEDIVVLLKKHNISRIFSVGVGGAALEYQIKKLLPEISLVCSDYSPITVERLKEVFVESDDVIEFDILNGNWSLIQEKYIGDRGLCLIYRLDAGFSDTEWQKIFHDLSNAGVLNVLVIPTGVLTLLSVYNRKKREFLWFCKKISTVFCGYVRTKKRFQEQWGRWYAEEETVLGGLKSFLLRGEKHS